MRNREIVFEKVKNILCKFELEFMKSQTIKLKWEREKLCVM